MKTKSDWPIVKLRDVCEVRKGTPITRSKVKPGNIPVIAGGQKPAYYHNEANRDGNVITVSASGAYAGYVQFFDTPIFASDCTTIKSLDESLLSTEFVYYALKAQQDRIYKLQHGAGQPHVYPKDLEIIRIPLPPLPEQRRIVAILRKADELRQLRRRANQRARDLLPALFDYVMEHADSWKSIGDVTLRCRKIDPTQSPEKEFAYIDISSIDSDAGRVTEAKRICGHEAPSRARQHVRKDDVLVSSVRPNLRNNAIIEVEPDIPLIASTGFVVLKANGKDTTPSYLYLISRSDWFTQELVRMVQGAAYPAVTESDVLKLKIPILDSATRLYVDKVVRGFLDTIKRYQETSEVIDNLFHSLLARAFTGELTAAWREAHADELRAAAAERDRLLGLEKKPEQVAVDVVGDTQALEKALSDLSSVAHALVSSVAQAALSPFTRSAEVLRPHLQPRAEEANRGLSAALEPLADEMKKQIVANARPLTEALRACYAPEFADLAEKIAELARLQLEEPIPRREIEARVLAVVGQSDGYVTLPDLISDWRLNHFPRQTIQEAVDMLVVRGQLRPATLKLETGDPERPYALAAAYAPVRAEDKITVDEIDL